MGDPSSLIFCASTIGPKFLEAGNKKYVEDVASARKAITSASPLHSSLEDIEKDIKGASNDELF